MDISTKTGQWLGYIGIVLAVIAFFWQSIWMSIIAIVLGIIGLFSDQKTVNWIAIAIAAVALIVAIV